MSTLLLTIRNSDEVRRKKVRMIQWVVWRHPFVWRKKCGIKLEEMSKHAKN